MKKLALLAGVAATLLTSPAHAGTDWTEFNFGPYSIIGQIQRLQMMMLTNIVYARSGISPAAFAEGGSASNNAATNDLGVWANVSRSHIDNDFSVTKYKGDVNAIAFGADKNFSDGLLAGVAVTFMDTALDTTFNRGNHDSKDYTIAPYASYELCDLLKTNFTVGYTRGSSDMDRYDTFVSRTVTGDQDYERFFAGANLVGTKIYDQFAFTGTTGFNFAHDRLDGYTDSEGTAFNDDTISLGEFSVGGRVDYKMDIVIPYFSMTYINDVIMDNTTVGSTQANPTDDSSAVRFAGGVNFIEQSNWSGGLAISSEFGREDIDTHSVSLGLKYKF